MGHRLAAYLRWEKHNVVAGAGVANNQQWFADLHYLNAKLLTQLASRCLYIRLTRLALPAGEFPKAAESLVGRTSAHEILAATDVVTANYRRDHTNARVVRSVRHVTA